MFNFIKKFLKSLVLINIFYLVLIPVSYGSGSETWMEIYSGDKKVGYSYTNVINQGNRKVLNDKTLINLDVLGLQTEMFIEGEYKLDQYYVSSFKYSVTSDSIGLNLTGKIEGNLLIINDIDKNEEHRINVSNKYLVPSILPEYIVNKGLVEGKVYQVYLFDPVNIFTGYDPDGLQAEITVLGKENIKTDFGEFSANKVLVKFLGTENIIWLTKDGKEVKEEFEPSLTSYISDKENALKKKNSSFKIAEKTSIPSSKYIHDPRNIKRMVVKISGLDSYKGLTIDDGNYQILKGDLVEIKPPELDGISGYNLPYKDELAAEFLSSSVLINKDDQNIVSQTRNIVKNEKNSLKAVKLINQWIYKTLEKIPTVSIPTAVDVLASKKGDCNEHSVLFTAMARSIGIPTKVVLGLLYLEGRFYYHAWNEVYIGYWVPVDSTFGQFPVDATHIKLLEGDISKSPEILRVVGKINLEIIETS
ncbi:MAG: transglutaminase-like domain-containing protein [Thermodesulfobacteriota bacterium]